MGDPVMSWTLTVVFALTAAYCVLRVIAGRSWIDRIHNGAHAAMSVVMLAMPWEWYTGIPTALQIVFFAVAASWYICLALFRTRARMADDTGHHQHRWFLWYHAAMMAAMVWMAVAMMPMPPSHQRVAEMSSTKMPSGDDSGMQMMTGMQPWGLAVSWGAGIFFAISGTGLLIWFVAQARRMMTGRGSVPSIGLADTASYVVMAAGMALAFLILMT